MLRPITITAAFFLLAFIPVSLHAQGAGDSEDIASPWAVTAEEKEQLLDRAETVLLWFRAMEREKRLGTPAALFREQMAPMELMQAAAILKEKGRGDASRMVREMLPFFQVTPIECFEIAERLGNDVLESFLEDKEILGGETIDSTTRIRQGADKFLNESLRPVEKMALMDRPETAFDLMKAIDVLAVAGRPVLIRYYLNQFLALEAEPEEYARIAEKLGSKKLMQIAINPNFTPQGGEAVAKVFAGAKEYWRDKGVIEQALEDWQGFDEQGKLKPESAEILRELWKGDRLSVVRLIDKLATVKDEKEVDELLAVILSFTADVKEALAESLQSDNETLVVNSARGLAESIGPQETFLLYPFLYGSSAPEPIREEIVSLLKKRGHKIPEAGQAAATLHARSRDYFEKNRPFRVGYDGYVRFWNWDESEKKAKYVRMLVPAAYRLYAWRYARQAWSIDPDQPEIKRLYLATSFERTAYLSGLDKAVDTDALDEIAADADTKLLERILVEGMAGEHYAAACGAAALLGKKGDAKDLLYSRDGKPRPLVTAVMARDRRLRFAALEAVMALKPETPFPGSSLVAETLAWFSRADGRRIMVSAHPKQAIAAKTAGHFIGCGYTGELAGNSRDAMRSAADSPDVELLAIDLICSNPAVPDIVQQMRLDARTADIPIAVLTDNPKVLDAAMSEQSLPTMQKVDRMSSDNPFALSLSKVYPRIVSDDGARWVDGDLSEKTGAVPVPPVLRLEQARKALGWIKDVVEQSREGVKIYHFEDFDDIVSRALRSDVRVEAGLDLAATVKSGGMQAAIYEVAASNVYPMELRETALEAFKQSIERFGVLLRGKQVQRLYDRYNISETEEKEVQDLLSRLIDIVEEKTLKD